MRNRLNIQTALLAIPRHFPRFPIIALRSCCREYQTGLIQLRGEVLRVVAQGLKALRFCFDDIERSHRSGGGKGVKLKNLFPLCGKPLLEYSANAIHASEYFDCAVISTDHEQIAEVGRENGLQVVHRPEELSGDRIGDWDVLNHALLEAEREAGVLYGVVVMLQPTSPLREAAHVRATIEKCVDKNWDAVWTVSPTDLKYHPLKALVIGEDGMMNLYDERGKQIIARQQLQPVYDRNGVAYALTRECILEQRSTLGAKWSAVVIEEPQVSIDTLEDFEKVESFMLKRSQCKLILNHDKSSRRSLPDWPLYNRHATARNPLSAH